MNLQTIWYLNYGDNGATTKTGDIIEVQLNNGEILIGEYSYSDYTCLNIERNNSDIDIDFSDVKDIQVLKIS